MMTSLYELLLSEGSLAFSTIDLEAPTGVFYRVDDSSFKVKSLQYSEVLVVLKGGLGPLQHHLRGARMFRRRSSR